MNKLAVFKNYVVLLLKRLVMILVLRVKNTLPKETLVLRRTISRCLFFKEIVCEKEGPEQHQYFQPHTRYIQRKGSNEKIGEYSCAHAHFKCTAF